MKIRYSTFEFQGVHRISFSSDELLYMINSLGDSDEEKAVKSLLEKLIDELDKESRRR